MSDIDWIEELRAHERAQVDDTNIARVAIVLFFIGLAVWGIMLGSSWDNGHWIINDSRWGRFFGYALVNIAPELAGIVIGVVTIDYLNERRQNNQLKAQLIRQMGMNINEIAVLAARELAHHGWLSDGSLELASLDGTDLQGAAMTNADLRKASLSASNLSGIELWGANLSETDLTNANLSEAKLGSCNLNGAVLWGANLSGAFLAGAILREASLGNTDLSRANLERAILVGAKQWTIKQLEQAAIHEGAIMPDGTQLGGRMATYSAPIDGPTFEEWKAEYLTNHGGSITDARNN